VDLIFSRMSPGVTESTRIRAAYPQERGSNG